MMLKHNKILGKGCKMSIKYVHVTICQRCIATVTRLTRCTEPVSTRHAVNKDHSYHVSFLQNLVHGAVTAGLSTGVVILVL